MRFEDFVLSFAEPPVRSTVEMERRWCACHCREIWVSKYETGPYFCSDNRKMLPAGEVGLEAAIL
jgi:hypothetical protein